MGVRAVSVPGDYTGEHGAAATKELLSSTRPPTAILYDNDLMAVSGLSVASQLGVHVPAQLSVVAWDDSALCELVHPSVTALHRDVAAVGAQGARSLLALAAGQDVAHRQEPEPTLQPRGSTGPTRS